MSEDQVTFDAKKVEELNQKSMKNSFFTPDWIYADLELFKDIPIGVIHTDIIHLKQDRERYNEVSEILERNLKDYQSRFFETISPYLDETGYTDSDIDSFLEDERLHNYIFLLSPVTKFIGFLYRQNLRNQNNSRPAEKFIRRQSDSGVVTEGIPVTLRINTWPLKVSVPILQRWGEEFGESFGMNIEFMCKDPLTFDQSDWDSWMKKIECFYVSSIERFGSSKFFLEKQASMELVSTYFYFRKRFGRKMKDMNLPGGIDYQIQLGSSRLGVMVDLNWIQNNDVRLTEEMEHVPMMEDDVIKDTSVSTA